MNNSHILLFDLHGEYSTAFPEGNLLNVDNLILPYWLMNSEELEEIFIESRESNSHNQISQFKHAVTFEYQPSGWMKRNSTKLSWQQLDKVLRELK